MTCTIKSSLARYTKVFKHENTIHCEITLTCDNQIDKEYSHLADRVCVKYRHTYCIVGSIIIKVLFNDYMSMHYNTIDLYTNNQM